MAINSFGYPGTVDAVAWSKLAEELGAKYGVMDSADWRVTPVAGPDRTVAVAAGTAFGRGVLDINTAPINIQLDAGTGAAGTVRYDLIVARRTWGATNTTTVVKINGTSAAAVPSGRLSGPGVQDDQPLALVKITTGSTVPVIEADLRTWPTKLVTANDLRSLVDASIGDVALIGDFTYQRIIDSSSNPVWQLRDSSPYALSFVAGTSLPPNRAYGVGTISVSVSRPGSGITGGLDSLLFARAGLVTLDANFYIPANQHRIVQIGNPNKLDRRQLHVAPAGLTIGIPPNTMIDDRVPLGFHGYVPAGYQMVFRQGIDGAGDSISTALEGDGFFFPLG